MNIQEFQDWMDTCPTHKWEVLSDEDGYIRILFPVSDELDEE